MTREASAGHEVVTVRIAGHDYKIRSDGDPDALHEIAGYVDRAMVSVRDRTNTIDTRDVAVLTCLNLAREILALSKGHAPTGTTAVDDAKLRALIEQVESTSGAQAASAQEASETTADSAAVEPPRTLELPSVETLRGRSSATGAEDDAAVERPRVAAGARDRAS